MTHGRELGGEVDLDLLADYIGGALDGTPESAAVERLIADDPAWTRAYAQTSAAIEGVRVDLATLAATEEQMPAEVVRRLDTVLTSVPHEKAALDEKAAPPDEGGEVVPLAGRRRARGDRRWPRRLMPVAAAAGVLVCVGLGVAFLSQQSSSTEQNSAGAAAAVPDVGRAPSGAAPQIPAEAGPGDAASAGPLMERDPATPARVVATGTDYTRETLAPPPLAASGNTRTGGQTDTASTLDVTRAPEQLRRLADPAALTSCVEAIETEHARPTTSVDLVDLARYDGTPAAVILFVDAGGARWAWVAGPDCGLNGADTRFSTQVG